MREWLRKAVWLSMIPYWTAYIMLVYVLLIINAQSDLPAYYTPFTLLYTAINCLKHDRPSPGLPLLDQVYWASSL